MQEHMILVGKILLAILCFNSLSVGTIGTIIVIRDSILKGRYVPLNVIIYTTLIFIGVMLLKGIMKWV